MRPEDRRTSPRYPPVQEQAHVGWWDGKHFRTTPARLQDICTGGAALFVDGPVIVPTAVWMCVVGQEPTEWVHANLVCPATSEDETRRVRLAFDQACPYEVFKTAVWGDQAARPPGPAPEVDDPPTSPTGLPPGDQPPLSPDLPVSRRAVVLSPGDEPTLTCVVVASASTTVSPPTLVEAERSRRASKDRMAALPWVVAFLVSLALTTALGFVVVERLGQFRLLEARVPAARK